MINNFITKTPAGLYCKTGDFYLDPKRAVQRALISHAHGDHAVPTTGEIFCTAPTQSFMKFRFAQRNLTFRTINFNESFNINGVEITFYPAGHILGSAQILMTYDGERYLYTGDFKIESDDSCETFQFVECDHLITETTFADPGYDHPDPVNEVRKLMSEDYRVVIGAYSLGKAQRLTQLLTKNCPDAKVFVNSELEPYHKMYENHGFNLGEWLPYRKSDFENSRKACYIVPPSYFKRYSFEANVLKVFATGWKRSFYRCDRVLPISDHADWKGVLEMINKTKAGKIYTVHGNGNHLKDYLKDKIDVKIIG